MTLDPEVLQRFESRRYNLARPPFLIPADDGLAIGLPPLADDETGPELDNADDRTLTGELAPGYCPRWWGEL